MNGLSVKAQKLMTALRMTDQTLPALWRDRIEVLLDLEGDDATGVMAIAMGTARKLAGQLGDAEPDAGTSEQNLLAAALVQGMVIGVTAAMLQVAEEQVRRNGGSL